MTREIFIQLERYEVVLLRFTTSVVVKSVWYVFRPRQTFMATNLPIHRVQKKGATIFPALTLPNARQFIKNVTDRFSSKLQKTGIKFPTTPQIFPSEKFVLKITRAE